MDAIMTSIRTKQELFITTKRNPDNEAILIRKSKKKLYKPKQMKAKTVCKGRGRRLIL